MAAPAGRKGRPRDKAREARLVADAAVFGQAETARRHGVSVKTVYRAVQRVADDADLAARVRNLSAVSEERHRSEVRRVERTWHEARERFLSKAFGRLEELLEEEPGRRGVALFIRAVSDAVDRAGSLDVAHGALNVPGHGAPLEGRAPAAPAGAGARALERDERTPAH